jgi:hypothetical protein
MRNKNANKNWSVKFGAVKSVSIDVVFKQEAKKNPYIRNTKWQKRKSVSMIGTNAEIY